MNTDQHQIKTASFASFVPFLILISFFSLLNTFVRTIFSPLVPYICQDLQLCHADAGNLFFILSIGFALTLFGSQFLSVKISHKMTLVLSLMTTGLALILTSFALDFTTLRFGMFLLGLSSGFFIPSAVATIREVVSNKHLGKAFGIFGSAQSVAFILSSLVVQFCIYSMSWQAILRGTGAVSLLVTALAIFCFKQGASRGEAVSMVFARTLFGSPSFWIILVLLCLANGLNVGIYNMAPDYFQCHNLIQGSEVSRLIEWARALSIGTAILAGVFADRFGLKRSIFAALIICGIVTSLMGLVAPSFSLFLFCFQSPIAACLMPLVHFAMATIVPVEKNASLISLMAPFAFLAGAGIVPQILGFFGDSNLYAEGFVIFGMIAMISGVCFNSSSVYRQVEISQTNSFES
ncbi:MAG: MFS transporter [Chlamydiota bacterium]